MRRIIPFFMALASLPATQAYIDPGTGGMIIGGSIWPLLVALFAAIGGFFVKFFRPIKRGVSRLWRKNGK